MHGEYGLNDVTLSMPAIVGKDGIETLVPMELDEKEQTELQHSSVVLKDVIKQAYQA